jgi:7-keto-8-aminopelargonate synthetase-like enzyme
MELRREREMGRPRERMKDLELPAYMRALAEARQRIAEESSDRLNELADNVEWLDAVAEALGIATSAEDWWDSIIEQKRTKILGRIAVLRGLRLAQETGVRCTCAGTPPTMPVYRTEHLPTCPAANRRVDQ